MLRLKNAFIAALCFGLASFVLMASEPTWSPPTLADVSQAIEGLPFDEFVDTSFNLHTMRFPQALTEFGMSSLVGVRDDRLNEFSEAYLEETRSIESAILAALSTYDRLDLSTDQQVIYDAYTWYWEDLVAQHQFPYPIDFFYYITYPAQLGQQFEWYQPVQNEEDVIDYLCRLGQVERQLDQLLAELQRYADMSVMPTRGALTWAMGKLDFVRRYTEYEVPFYTVLRDGIHEIEELTRSERSAYLGEASRTIKSQIIPAYKRFHTGLRSLRDRATDDIGLFHVPHGPEFYTYSLHHYTQTELTAEQWHQIGLDAVDRSLHDVRESAVQAGISGDLTIAEIVAEAEAASELLEGTDIVDRYVEWIEWGRTHASEMVGFVPEFPYEVIEDDRGGMYFDPALDGTRPAVVYVGVLGERPADQLPTVAFHEMYPGHHLQRAVATSYDLPLFLRKTLMGGYHQGFVEGWGFYTERLIHEAGWLDDVPLANVIHARYDLIRKVAIVVNTGIHALGWTEDHVVDYYVTTLGSIERDARSYLYNAHLDLPGYYPGYAMGRVKIEELRTRAQTALGDTFSLPEFHDAILRWGAVPLSLLDQLIDEYIEANTST